AYDQSLPVPGPRAPRSQSPLFEVTISVVVDSAWWAAEISSGGAVSPAHPRGANAPARRVKASTATRFEGSHVMMKSLFWPVLLGGRDDPRPVRRPATIAGAQARSSRDASARSSDSQGIAGVLARRAAAGATATRRRRDATRLPHQGGRPLRPHTLRAAAS